MKRASLHSPGWQHPSHLQSIRDYLLKAKAQLQAQVTLKGGQGKVDLVIGNESADLDSITSALVYGFTHSGEDGDILIPVTNIPASDLPLRPELTTLLRHADVSPSDLITLDDLGEIPLPLEAANVWLVDHNALQGSLGKHYADSICGVIDHHDDEGKVPRDAHPRIIEKSGSCSSLVANYCHGAWEDIASKITSANSDEAHIGAQVAKLALGSILIDTYDLKSEDKVTSHDLKAVGYLETVIRVSDEKYDRDTFFEEINTAKSSLDSLSVPDILRKDYKQWSEGELTLGISSVVKPIAYLDGKITEADGDIVRTLVSFAREHSLHLYAVMTAYTTESGDFARQLLLLSLEDGNPTAAVHRFVKSSSNDLQLRDLDNDVCTLPATDSLPFCQLWDQKNIAASRKQVGPMLREAMQA